MRNAYEERVAAQLGPAWEYEAIKLSYQIEHTYTPDFIDRATKTIREAKGLFDAADRRKMLAVKAQHPGWTIIMVFQNPDRKISKGSKTRYRDWCERNGIAWEQGPSAKKKVR